MLSALTLGGLFHLGYFDASIRTCAAWIQSPTYANYVAPPPSPLPFVDDRLEDKQPVFDPESIDTHPVNGWQVNASAAVLRLDTPLMNPDVDRAWLELRATYSEAIASVESGYPVVLPSAVMLDAASKPFNDGLVAALEAGCLNGQLEGCDACGMLAGVLKRLPPGSPARARIGAALQLAGAQAELTRDETARAERLLRQFERNGYLSQPRSLYGCRDDLTRVWRFFQFLSQRLDEEVARDLRAAIEADSELRDVYHRVVRLRSLLCDQTQLAIVTQWRPRTDCAVFPPSRAPEVAALNGITPQEAGARGLMGVLIDRLRSNPRLLRPTESSGWAGYRAYALQPLLAPSLAEQNQHLLLTAAYKRRLVESFEAVLVHNRDMFANIADQIGAVAPPPPPLELRPRLRIEPCATFYLRTARAYAFVTGALESVLPRRALDQISALHPVGARAESVAEELAELKKRFVGFYLISCEDVGLRPHLAPSDSDDPLADKQHAEAWLHDLHQNADLRRDVRSPAAITPQLAWGILGVRMTPLEVRYVRPPHVRRLDASDAIWREAEQHELRPASYLMPTEAVAEFHWDFQERSLTRQRFRDMCGPGGRTESEVMADLR